MRWELMAGALVVCVACGPSSRTSPSVDGSGGADRTDAGSWSGRDGGACTEVVDVVLVLDVSSSMGFVLDDLEADIDRVVEAANELAPDAHVGLIAFADNHMLDDSGDLESGRVHTRAGSLVSAFRRIQSTYTDANRNPGDGPGGPTLQNPICEENALDALYAAAADYPWRDNATRVVILASDDTFLERPDNYGDRDGDGDTTSTTFPREGDYPAAWTVPETVAALTDARARVFSFTRLRPPDLLPWCDTPRRFDWDAITDGWSTAYGGNQPIPDATDGRNFDLADVQAGDRSLADTINEVVVESHCNPVD